MNESLIRNLLDSLEHEIDNAEKNRAAPRGGQHVPFHGDFANVSTSGLIRLRWWVRALRDALDGAVT